MNPYRGHYYVRDKYQVGLMYMPWLEGKSKPWFVMTGNTAVHDKGLVVWSPDKDFYTEDAAKAEMSYQNTMLELLNLRNRGFDEYRLIEDGK